MPIVRLRDRAIIDVTGADAESFLQNILTTDLGSLAEGEAKGGALLSPQGKILFDFLISRVEGGLRLDLRADLADDLMRRLTLYRLRAKADIAKQNQMDVAVAWDIDSTASGDESTVQLSDARFPAEAGVWRFYGTAVAGNADEAVWTAQRLRYGIAESGTDYTAGDAFPHDVLLDQNGGVGLRKGCYVGQEVVSRMHHRGTARRRVLLVHGEVDLPVPGTPVTAAGKPVGALGSVLGQDGMAILRIDRVKDAIDAGTPLLAGDIAVTATIPDWASFRFPEPGAASDVE